MASTEPDNLGKVFLDATLVSYRANKGWADKAITQLPDEALHRSLDPNTNCIAVIMKHVAGNLLSRWTDFLTAHGEKAWRKRYARFRMINQAIVTPTIVTPAHVGTATSSQPSLLAARRTRRFVP